MESNSEMDVVVSDAVLELLERTHRAYSQGQYMQVLGTFYQSYVESVSREVWMRGVLEKPEYRDPLVAAFASHSPNAEEIYLYACEDSMVATSERLFLLDHNGLTQPPIALETVADCEDSGFWMKKLSLVLQDGSRIEHKRAEVVDGAAILKLAGAHQDSAKREALRIVPARLSEEPTALAVAPEQEWVLERLHYLADALVEGEPIQAIALTTWESSEGSGGRTLSLWAGRALLGIVGDILFSGKIDALGVAVITDQSLHLGRIGDILQGTGVEERHIQEAGSVVSVLQIPLQSVITDGNGNTFVVQTETEPELTVTCPAGLIENNQRFPLVLLRARSGNDGFSDTADKPFAPAAEPQTGLMLERMKDHCARIHAASPAHSPFIAAYLSTELLGTLASFAEEKMALTREDGQPHSMSLNNNGVEYCIYTFPYDLEQSARWFATEYAGYMDFLNRLAATPAVAAKEPETLVHLVFGSGGVHDPLWFTMSIVPLSDERQSFLPLLATDFLTDLEAQQLAEKLQRFS